MPGEQLHPGFSRLSISVIIRVPPHVKAPSPLASAPFRSLEKRAKLFRGRATTESVNPGPGPPRPCRRALRYLFLSSAANLSRSPRSASESLSSAASPSRSPRPPVRVALLGRQSESLSSAASPSRSTRPPVRSTGKERFSAAGPLPGRPSRLGGNIPRPGPTSVAAAARPVVVAVVRDLRPPQAVRPAAAPHALRRRPASPPSVSPSPGLSLPLRVNPGSAVWCVGEKWDGLGWRHWWADAWGAGRGAEGGGAEAGGTPVRVGPGPSQGTIGKGVLVGKGGRQCVVGYQVTSEGQVIQCSGGKGGGGAGKETRQGRGPATMGSSARGAGLLFRSSTLITGARGVYRAGDCMIFHAEH